MFERFVVGEDDEDHRFLTGVITEAKLLREKGAFSSRQLARLQEVFDWFNENIPVPPYSENEWPKGSAAWFKSDSAKDAIERIGDVVQILEIKGQPVRVLRSRNPGIWHYEDEFQVVVSEFRSLDY